MLYLMLFRSLMKHLMTSLTMAALLAACAGPTGQSSPSSQTGQLTSSVPTQPEGASGYTPKPGWATTKFAVAAANPLATEAGYQILKAGGSAVDAAIAVQMVLTLVEPRRWPLTKNSSSAPTVNPSRFTKAWSAAVRWAHPAP
jgi:Gamma-glutamyltranspeptidase